MPSLDDRATRATYWQQHILRWRSSQLSQIAYCREHTLNFHRFNYWLRKGDPVKTKKQVATPSTAFVPVVKHPATLTSLSLSLPNGIIVQGIDSTNLEAIKHLMNILL